jgi:hypothetical protein
MKNRSDSIVKIIYGTMVDGDWWTIPELRAELAKHGRSALDTGISARIRDLRKAPWRRIVDSRPRDGMPNTIEYCLVGDWQRKVPEYDGNQAKERGGDCDHDCEQCESSIIETKGNVDALVGCSECRNFRRDPNL